jgi:hypothetical protein
MIVEDHDMLNCLATYGYKSRPDREAPLLSSRCGIQQPVDSNHHHSFLKRSKIDILEKLRFLARSFPRCRLLLAVVLASRSLGVTGQIETEQ